MHAVLPTTGRDTLPLTLQSLTDCRTPPDFEGVVVVENGTPTPTVDLTPFSADLDLEYIHVAEPGKSKALNRALGRLDDELVVFFDDDVRVPPHILTSYFEASREEGRAFFGGPIDVDYERPPAAWLLSYLPPSVQGWGLNGIEHVNHPWFIGSNWAAFAGDIRRAGGFDENIGPGSRANSVGEETDLQKRLYEAGLQRVFVPEAKVWHHVSEEQLSPQWVLHRKYRIGLSQGYQDGSRLPVWVLKETAQNALRLARKLLRAKASETFDERASLYRLMGVIHGYARSLPGMFRR